MVSFKLPAFPTFRPRFRRQMTETLSDTLSDALTVLPRGFPIRVHPRPARHTTPQNVGDVAEEIDELYRELKAKIAAREAHSHTTVAAPQGATATGGEPLSPSSSPPSSSPKPSYERSSSKNHDERIANLLNRVAARMSSLALYPIDGTIAKENISHFRVRDLRKLNFLLRKADFPDYLIVHYTRVNPKPVAYVRVLPSFPKDALMFINPDVLEGVGLHPRVAHLHISDDEQITTSYHSSERNAVFTLPLGKQQTVLRSRVMAKMAPAMCTAHQSLQCVATSANDYFNRHIASGRHLPVDYPIFYGMYLPYESIGRNMHTECEHGISGCQEMSPIMLIEDIDSPPVQVMSLEEWRAAPAKREAPFAARPPAVSAM
ncbi:hypothetical protein L226DRAFT_575987 [Lentinus tigrinus ALCF2SS1-7]|uniref:Uncharacterized protein n=1 Tax=Lentinus tigrinus ALCF2SS1-6 TaxID=1328759 RepID=A0A5C2S542_9APHY|nr:hypothetical protein L227DRAFT_576794 [Lentinus tigrinus ALCF2SS1-6]RPD68915.1 hypothetical protein L226DRAFT_575987 [Lentinus tigrinus ALCF2SS1-7]